MGVYSELSQGFKDVAEIAKKVQSNELNTALISLQQTMLEANAELAELKKKVDELSVERTTEVYGGMLFIGDDRTTPYCVHCWGESRKLNPLSMDREKSGEIQHTCLTCKQFGYLTNLDGLNIKNIYQSI